VNITKTSRRLGANIKKIRTKKHMSQGDICRKLDMDRSYMSAVESGRKNITLVVLERLATALGVSPNELLK
jgi:transcriptional regulator with XRE-family HTH domain